MIDADSATGPEMVGNHHRRRVSGSVSCGAVEHDVFASQFVLEEKAEVVRDVVKPALVSNVDHARKCVADQRQVVAAYGRAVCHL